MTPYVLVQGLGGPVIDRIGAWRASIVTDVGAALTMAAIPTLHTTTGLPIPALVQSSPSPVPSVAPETQPGMCSSLERESLPKPCWSDPPASTTASPASPPSSPPYQ